MTEAFLYPHPRGTIYPVRCGNLQGLSLGRVVEDVSGENLRQKKARGLIIIEFIRGNMYGLSFGEITVVVLFGDLCLYDLSMSFWRVVLRDQLLGYFPEDARTLPTMTFGFLVFGPEILVKIAVGNFYDVYDVPIYWPETRRIETCVCKTCDMTHFLNAGTIKKSWLLLMF